MIERDLSGYGPNSPSVRWPGDARVAVSFMVHFEEGAERSPVYGDPAAESSDPESSSEGGSAGADGTRDLQTESVWEYGSRCGIWRLLRIFDEHSMRVTFS